MRVLATIEIDTDAGNEANRSGVMQQTMRAFLEQVRPEAAYFTPTHGQRCAYVVFHMSEPSRMPVLFEPLFQTLNAKIEVRPVMNTDDLMAASAEVQAEAGR